MNWKAKAEITKEIRAIIVETWPQVVDNQGSYNPNLVEKINPQAFKKLMDYRASSRNAIHSLVWRMKKDGSVSVPRNGEHAATTPKATRVDANPFYTTELRKRESKSRIRWTDDEIKALATKCVELRLDNPIALQGQIALDAVNKVFANDSARKRALSSIGAHPGLMREFSKQWREAVAKITAVPEENLKVVTVEVQKQVTFEEMLSQIDIPTMKALLATKEAQSTNLTQELLREIAINCGSKNAPKVAPFIPPAALFGQEKERLKRIVIVGPFKEQFHHIEQQAKEAGLKLDLRWLDKEEQHLSMPHADFIIVTQHVRHRVWYASLDQIGKDRVFFVDGGIGAVVQKLRDINSRK